MRLIRIKREKHLEGGDGICEATDDWQQTGEARSASRQMGRLGWAYFLRSGRLCGVNRPRGGLCPGQQSPGGARRPRRQQLEAPGAPAPAPARHRPPRPLRSRHFLRCQRRWAGSALLRGGPAGPTAAQLRPLGLQGRGGLGPCPGTAALTGLGLLFLDSGHCLASGIHLLQRGAAPRAAGGSLHPSVPPCAKGEYPLRLEYLIHLLLH